MFRESDTPIADLGLSAAALAVAGLLFWGAREIPPPFFDPLGSAAVPQACATLLVAFAAIILVSALRRLRRAGRIAQPPPFKPAPGLALATFGLSAAYTAVIGAQATSFQVATTLYVFLAGSLLGRFRRRVMLVTGPLALVLGVGGQYLFTRFFYIDLPQ